MAVTAHELARELLRCEDLPIEASIDISTDDTDSGRRIFTDDCFGVNSIDGDAGTIVLLFYAVPVDNYEKRL